MRVTQVTRVPGTTSCRPILHQGALARSPAPPYSQAQEHTHRRVCTHSHARTSMHLERGVRGFIVTGWKRSDGSGQQPGLLASALLDPGVSQELGLEVTRDRDGAGETSCSSDLSRREGPGGVCGRGRTARLASWPHPPAGAGQVGTSVCGGCRATLLGWWERGRPAQDWPPWLLRELSGEKALCLRMCFQAGVGGTSQSPSVPPSLLSPCSVQDPAGCQGGHQPILASTPPSTVCENTGPLGLIPRAVG